MASLTPWRFVIVGEGQRDAFEAVLRRALSEDDRDAFRPPSVEKERNFAHYAGELVVLDLGAGREPQGARLGTAIVLRTAGMNLLLAAHASGYVRRLGDGVARLFRDGERRAFCKPGEQIAGFIFIGHEGRELEERARPNLAMWSSRGRRPTKRLNFLAIRCITTA